jgi:dipeptidyl aminopeptidase/acylaminoacyl peptidase
MMKRAVGLVAFMMVLGSLLSVSAAWAAFPGGNGRLAFENGGNLFSVRADGAGLMQLTSDGQSHDPAWSPSGKRIAFSRRGFIFVMAANGTGARKVSRLGHSIEPAWSPDGKRIAFVHEPVGRNGDIWIVRAAGGTPTRLTHDAGNTGDYHPTWSPLGGRIAFDTAPSVETIGSQIIVLRLKTGARTSIDHSTGRFAGVWSPDFTSDGRGIILSSLEDLADGPDAEFPGPLPQVSNLAGTSRDLLTSDPICAEGAPCVDGEVAAAPDSTLASPHAAWVETLDEDSGFGFCVNTTPTGGFCHVNDNFPYPSNIDWQPIPR